MIGVRTQTETAADRSVAKRRNRKALHPLSKRRGDAVAYHHTREQLHLLEAAIQQTTDAIVITTADLEHPGPQIVYVNSAFTTLTGYTAEETIGQMPRVLQGPKTEKAELDRARRALQTGQPFSGEVMNYRKDSTAYVLE